MNMSPNFNILQNVIDCKELVAFFKYLINVKIVEFK